MLATVTHHEPIISSCVKDFQPGYNSLPGKWRGSMKRTHEKCNLRLILILAALLGSTALVAPSARAATTFNVKSFGATGNGVTDDTTAILNALAAANAVPG